MVSSPPPSPPPFWDNHFSRHENRMSFEKRRASKQASKQASKSGHGSDENHGTRVSSPLLPLLPPFFPRFLAHRKPGRCPTSTSFLPFFFTDSRPRPRAIVFFSPLLGEFSSPGVRQRVAGRCETRIVSKTTREKDVTQRPLLQPVAHFGR